MCLLLLFQYVSKAAKNVYPIVQIKYKNAIYLHTATAFTTHTHTILSSAESKK